MLNRQLQQARELLHTQQVAQHDADDRKNQFVVTLAHELRGPLSTLKLSLALLRERRGMDAEFVDKRHEVMERQVAQLTKLVDDLMDAGSVSRGQSDLVRKRVELNQLVAEALEFPEGAIAKKGHDLSLSANKEPLWVCADASRLKQVFSNLVLNAARYTPSEGRIVVEVRSEDGNAVVDVIDNGIGLSPGDLHNIFGLFVQARRKPEGAEGAEGGLGIGLALVRRLVQDHGGTVVAASDGEGRGSQFTVTLPLAEPSS
jgi:signal transduction histidine kinase